jgi:hypothetical protein
LLGEAAKHEDRSGLADLEYLRTRGCEICRNEDAPSLNVEEDAERGAEVNHPDQRNEILVFGQAVIVYRFARYRRKQHFCTLAARGARRGAFCESPLHRGVVGIPRAEDLFFVWLYLLSSVSGFLIADIVIIVLLYRAVGLLSGLRTPSIDCSARSRPEREGLSGLALEEFGPIPRLAVLGILDLDPGGRQDVAKQATQGAP